MNVATTPAELLTTDARGDTVHLHLRGDWVLKNAELIAVVLDPLVARTADQLAVTVDFTQLKSMDLPGAWMLHGRLQPYDTSDRPVRWIGPLPESLAFVREAARDPHAEIAAPSEEAAWLARKVAAVGQAAVHQVHQSRDAVAYFGEIVTTGAGVLRNPRRFRLPAIVRQVHETGIQAIPIVSLIAFLISVIVAYLSAQQLRQFGADIFTVDLVAIAVLRELGVLLTSIIVAGRSGSAFAAEIGVMRLNDEVDALKSIGISPFEVLVLPRMVGLLIALPLLTIIADAMGLAGGALLSAWLLDISFTQFLTRMQEILAPTTFWAGLIKAPVFAALIAMVGTYRGMQVRDSSRELGRLTTVAVVESIFLVILADAVFAVVFVELDF